ncbi:MAG: hypothetical protein IJZ33_00830, partial [Clostridia bacterium]|nr:hypothetical protein [Clostridia bacterium]
KFLEVLKPFFKKVSSGFQRRSSGRRFDKSKPALQKQSGCEPKPKPSKVFGSLETFFQKGFKRFPKAELGTALRQKQTRPAKTKRVPAKTKTVQSFWKS